MILPHFGKWSSSAGIWFKWERIYWKGHWTPFCKVKRRWVHYREVCPRCGTPMTEYRPSEFMASFHCRSCGSMFTTWFN